MKRSDNTYLKVLRAVTIDMIHIGRDVEPTRIISIHFNKDEIPVVIKFESIDGIEEVVNENMSFDCLASAKAEAVKIVNFTN